MEYKDLEALKNRFDDATVVLRRQMKDREKREARKHPQRDDFGDILPYITEDGHMAEEFVALKDFCVESRKAIRDHVEDSEYQKIVAEKQRLADE